MREHFGIGGRPKVVTLKPLPEAFVVFDDAVVNHRNSAALVPVRMRIFIRRRPMRRPARVAEAELSVQWFGGQEPAETFVDFPFSFPGQELAAAHHTEAGAVVTTIFEPPQTFDDDGSRFLFTDVAND